VRISAMRIGELDPELRITFSAIVASSHPLERFDEAIQRAHHAMYRAKGAGAIAYWPPDFIRLNCYKLYLREPGYGGLAAWPACQVR
jgi:GGDEF domain-containing protein